MRGKDLSRDSRATASFAFAAVAILLSVTVLSGIVIQMENSSRRTALANAETRTIAELARMISAECGLALQMATSRILGGENQGFNLSIFERDLRKEISNYFSNRYPVRIGTIEVNVTLQNLTTVLGSCKLNRNDNVSSPGSIIATAILKVHARSERINYRTEIEVEKEIETPVPFLASQIAHIDKAAKLEGLLGRIVRNILMQLAQLRVAQGYGSPGHPEGRGVGDIVTARDVEIAVNLALQLTALADFGRSDQAAWRRLLSESRFDGNLSIDADWFDDELDPFKTYLLLRQKETSHGVNARDFAVQVLYSLIDKIVLRYLDYLNLIDLAEVFQTGKFAVDETWKAVILILTGVDERLEEAQGWVSERLAKIGIPEALWKSLFSESQEIIVQCNLTYIYIFDRSGHLVPIAIGGASVPIDIPSRSIIDSDIWMEYYPKIASQAISVGRDIELIVTAMCMDIARNLDNMTVYGSFNSRIPLVVSIIDSLRQEFRKIRPETGLSSEKYTQILSCDRTLLELRDFVSSFWDELVSPRDIIDSARTALATYLADNALVPDPSVLPDGWKDEVRAVIKNELSSGCLKDWNRTLTTQVDALSNERKSCMLWLLDCAANRPLEIDGTIPRGLLDLTSYGTLQKELLRGLDDWVGLLNTQLRNMTSELNLDERLLASSCEFIELKKDGSWDGTGLNSSLYISPDVQQSPKYLHSYEIRASHEYDLRNVDPFDKLCVIIESPITAYSSRKSVHYTSLDCESSFPYENNWLVKTRGLVELLVTDGLTGQSVKERVLIDLEIPITAISGWALEGVKYDTSNTLLGDAWALLVEVKNKLWEFISPLLELFGKAFKAIYDAFSKLSRYISGFAEKLTKLFFEIGSWIASSLKDAVDCLRASPFWGMIEIAIDLLGRIDVRFEYGPFGVIVSLSLPDLLFKKAKDLVRIIFVLRLGELGLAWGFRIAELANGMIDIVANSTIKYGKQLRIDLVCDPLMEVKDHMFEIKVVWEKLKLMIWSPEVDDYSKASIELKNLPGLGPVLASIPIPVLGISVSINAGLTMKYRLPLCDQLVINEVELNPAGTDAGREWVEIYNPLDKEIELKGYSLETMHGEIAALSLDGVIAPRGYRVFTFSKTSLDNGNPGDSFAFGDSIALLNPDGDALDITPVISDTTSNSDTWHRSWDGAPKWVFGKGSKGTTNGNPLIHAYPDLLSKLCVDALIRALQDEADNVSASLGFVTNVFRSFLVELINVSAEFIASLVHEVALFVEFGINDISGTAGVGVKIKVSFGEEFVKMGILWFIEQLARLISNLFLSSPISPNLLAHARPLEEIYLGVDFYTRIGTPRVLSVLFTGTSVPSEVRMAITVSINLATLGSLFGQDWGRFKVVFGVHLDDLPGMKLIRPLTVRREKVDIWLLRGTLSPA
ncbi:MAG: lamin tail domain-containing protein [Thermoplasmata archaeon]